MSDQNPSDGQNCQPENSVANTNAQFGRRLETPSAGGYSDDYVARSPEDVLQPRDVPPPPTRSKQARNRLVVFLNFCLSSLVLLTLAVGAAFYFGKVQFEAEGPRQTARTIVIEEGSGLSQIAGKLSTSGIIDSEMIFSRGVVATGNQSALKPGEYAFKPKMSMREVMETIVSGKGIIHKVSIPEGLTSYQIMQRIAKNEILEGEMPEEIPAEGSIMPDTYPFQRGTTRKELIELMRSAQERFLAEVWEKRIDGLPINSPEEMVVLASIVEKETVVLQRLRKGGYDSYVFYRTIRDCLLS